MKILFWNPSQRRRKTVSKSEESRRKHVLSMVQVDSGIPEIIRQRRKTG